MHNRDPTKFGTIFTTSEAQVERRGYELNSQQLASAKPYYITHHQIQSTMRKPPTDLSNDDARVYRTDLEPQTEEHERVGVKTYIGGVGDELPEEDLLVGVKGVDDEGEQLVDLRLEGERLRLRGHCEALPEREERRGGGGSREEASRVCGEREREGGRDEMREDRGV